MHAAGLAGKRALITGGGSGIGRAAADRFAAEGARVAILDVDGDRAAAAAAQLGDAALGLGADVRDEAQVRDAFAAACAHLGGLDVVVANAAVQLFGEDARVHELDAAVWDRTHAVNLRGAFLTCKHGVRALLAGGGGSIVVTASPTGLRGLAPDFAAYSASKGGTLALMRTIATGYAGDGIRANAVVPGFTDTPLVETLTADPVQRQARAATIPLGRPGRPEEVAAMIAWLGSDDAGYVTGAIFTVDGGRHAR